MQVQKRLSAINMLLKINLSYFLSLLDIVCRGDLDLHNQSLSCLQIVRMRWVRPTSWRTRSKQMRIKIPRKFDHVGK